MTSASETSTSIEKNFSEILNHLSRVGTEVIQTYINVASKEISTYYKLPEEDIKEILNSVIGQIPEKRRGKGGSIVIPDEKRCEAKLKSGKNKGERCTRKKKHSELCGMHSKARKKESKGSSIVNQQTLADYKKELDINDFIHIQGALYHEETRLVFKERKKGGYVAVGYVQIDKDNKKKTVKLNDDNVKVCENRGWEYTTKYDKSEYL